MGDLDAESRHSWFPEDFIWRPLGNIDFAILPSSIVRMFKVQQLPFWAWNWIWCNLLQIFGIWFDFDRPSKKAWLMLTPNWFSSWPRTKAVRLLTGRWWGTLQTPWLRDLASFGWGPHAERFPMSSWLIGFTLCYAVSCMKEMWKQKNTYTSIICHPPLLNWMLCYVLFPQDFSSLKVHSSIRCASLACWLPEPLQKPIGWTFGS